MKRAISQYEEKECLTPGAIYHISIDVESISCKIDFPFELDLGENEAEELEQKIHNAMEEILSKFFKTK